MVETDLISRQQAFDALRTCYDTETVTMDNGDEYINYGDAVGEIEQLPSVHPEQRWIPCSDRMPEEYEWIGTKRFGTTISDEVYVTFEAPDGQRFADHISFQNGKLSRSDAEKMRVWYKGAKPIAWKPQPEPYQGGEQEQ